jgi:hypothetical protein
MIRERAAKTALASKRVKTQETFGTVQQLLGTFRFDSLIDPKAERQADLKGDKDLVYYCKPRDPNFTHYSGFYNGQQIQPDRKAVLIDTFTTSAM